MGLCSASPSSMSISKCAQVGIHPSPHQADRVPGPELGSGDPEDQMWPLPPGAPVLGVGQKSHGCPCGQSISVLISRVPGRGWVQDGPPGSQGLGGPLGQPVRADCVWPNGQSPAQALSLTPPCFSQGPSAGPSHLVAPWLLNLQEACGISLDSQPS